MHCSCDWVTRILEVPEVFLPIGVYTGCTGTSGLMSMLNIIKINRIHGNNILFCLYQKNQRIPNQLDEY